MASGGGRMEGKVAIVTGSGSGFGAAIAQRLAAEGCKVLIGDINVDGATRTAKTIGNAANTIVRNMNVTKEADWRSAVAECIEKYGKLDCVVNNAGWSYKNTPTANVAESDFDRTFEINVKSIFMSAQVAIPQMQKQGHGGSIINISSIGSFRPRPGLVWYNASKAAVSNATKGLAAEYGPDQIRVNAICPLLSGTGLFEAFSGVPFTEENVAKHIGVVPMGRLTDPLDVANMALFLACDESKFVTGANLQVDGGKSI